MQSLDLLLYKAEKLKFESWMNNWSNLWNHIISARAPEPETILQDIDKTLVV